MVFQLECIFSGDIRKLENKLDGLRVVIVVISNRQLANASQCSRDDVPGFFPEKSGRYESISSKNVACLPRSQEVTAKVLYSYAGMDLSCFQEIHMQKNGSLFSLS